MLNVTKFEDALTNAVDDANKTMAKWKKELDERPLRAMHWSKAAFEAAAEIQVYGDILYMIRGSTTHHGADKPELIAESVQRYVVDMALCRASSLESSSSVTANLSEDCIRQCWAKAARFRNLWL